MKPISAFLVSAALFVTVAYGQGPLTINTPPDAVECEPTQLTWSGGTAPYFLSILPGSQPTAPALENLGQQNGTSFTWNTNIAAGTSVGLTLRDSTGALAQSAAFTIQAGVTTACVGLPVSSGPAGTATAPPPTSPTTTAAGPPTTGGASPTTSPHATTGGGSTGAGSTPSSKPNTGSVISAQFGAAGVFAAALAALLA